MIQSKGFTIIELLIVVFMIAIVTIGISSMVTGNISEMVQRGGTICKSGVLFSIDANGFQQQVIGPQGGGVECR